MDPLQELRTALRRTFAWFEDDHMITLRCAACGRDVHYTHHTNPDLIAADALDHLQIHRNMIRYLEDVPDA